MSLSKLLADNSLSWNVEVKVDMGRFIVGPFTTKAAARLWIKEAEAEMSQFTDPTTKFTTITSFRPKESTNATTV